MVLPELAPPNITVCDVIVLEVAECPNRAEGQVLPSFTGIPQPLYLVESISWRLSLTRDPVPVALWPPRLQMSEYVLPDVTRAVPLGSVVVVGYQRRSAIVSWVAKVRVTGSKIVLVDTPVSASEPPAINTCPLERMV